MLLIIPYKSMGFVNLDSTISEIESLLGKGQVDYVDIEGEKFTNVSYKNGITVVFKNELSCFIGVATGINICSLEDFSFEGRSYDQILAYFKEKKGNIFHEDETMLISETLGISAFFEDGLKEVGMFTREYLTYLSEGLSEI